MAKKPYNPILGEIFQCHWTLPNDTEENAVSTPPPCVLCVCLSLWLWMSMCPKRVVRGPHLGGTSVLVMGAASGPQTWQQTT